MCRVFEFRCGQKCSLIYVACVVLLYGSAGQKVYEADPPPVVTVTPIPPTPPPTIFDPNNPPNNLPPGENADTSMDVQVTGGNASGTFDGTTLTVTQVGPVKVEGSITTRLPSDAGQGLKDHEGGHDTLSRDEYNRTAKKKTEDAFRGLQGMKFTGTGNTPQERLENAQKQLNDEITARQTRAAQGIGSQSGTLNNKYDKLTGHGTNTTVTTPAGMTAAKKELGLAAASGVVPLTPGTAVAGGANQPVGISFNAETSLLTFDLSAAAVTLFSHDAGDPLNGASLSLFPLPLIGLQENGTTSLATSEFDIISGGETVLHGFLVEAAYFPVSSVEGFAGMIQGYLDIPPEYTGAGINNFLGSQFLSDYQQQFSSDTTAGLSTLWLYTTEPLFDSSGQYRSTSGVGALRFGIAHAPESGSSFLYMLIALGTVWFAVSRSSPAGQH